MRLKHVFISEYKNLKNFSVDFTGENFMDVFVGKNGSGKSNFFEALILVFRHLYEFNDADATIYEFDYKLTYEIGDEDVAFEWKAGSNTLKINGRVRKTLSNIPLPDNILVYYSGQNNTISELLGLYQSLFSKKIKGAEVSDIRKFIGIGGPYKELLLSLILAQPEGSKAKAFLEEKLKIKNISSELKVTLKRPEYALGNDEYDITDNDDAAIRYWGAKGISKAFLESIRDCISLDTTNRTRAEAYQGGDDRYIHYYDITKLQAVVEDEEALYLFRMLDNLKLIGMLEQVTIDIELEDGYNASISDFSDGQFQSVYIYAITELFKESNCITLLDEPDAFLHPEWQFDFLKQIDEISEGAAQTNHVIMTSHSASTISTLTSENVRCFTGKPGESAISYMCKSDVVDDLSSGLISFSEKEAVLNMHHIIRNSSRPILFTEGITDEIIIEQAWAQLYPDQERSFDVQSAFSCGFLRTLMKDQELYQNNPGRKFFALFDFDEAHNDWNQLGDVIETDPYIGLTKKRRNCEGYSILLPVPHHPDISRQVINPNNEMTYKNKSLLTIEHYFYGVNGLEQYFVPDIERTDGFIKFISNAQKVYFSKEIVPSLPKEKFVNFIPLFELINNLSRSNDEVAA